MVVSIWIVFVYVYFFNVMKRYQKLTVNEQWVMNPAPPCPQSPRTTVLSHCEDQDKCPHAWRSSAWCFRLHTVSLERHQIAMCKVVECQLELNGSFIVLSCGLMKLITEYWNWSQNIEWFCDVWNQMWVNEPQMCNKAVLQIFAIACQNCPIYHSSMRENTEVWKRKKTKKQDWP